MSDTARIDKWLWAARIFKTRSIAADACKNGRVTMGGVNVKPSRSIKAGEVIDVRKPPVTYSFKILKPIESRVGAKLIPEIYEKMDEAGHRANRVVKAPPCATYNQLLSGNVIGNLTGIYDRQKVGKVEFLHVHHEDYVLWLSILKQGFIAKNTNTTNAAYRIVAGSISANKLKVLPWQWSVYRDIEGLSLLRSSYHFINYAFKAYFKSKI